MRATKQDIADLIQTANVVPDVSILRSDVPLQDQGIDSLGLFSVMLLLEEKYNIKVNDDDLELLTTIDSMVIYTNSKIS